MKAIRLSDCRLVAGQRDHRVSCRGPDGELAVALIHVAVVHPERLGGKAVDRRPDGR